MSALESNAMDKLGNSAQDLMIFSLKSLSDIYVAYFLKPIQN